MSSPLRIGVLGMTHDHIWDNLADVKASQDANVVAVADPNQPLLGRAEAEYQCRPYSNYETMLDPSKIIICSIPAHSTGKNLQHFSNQLIVDPPRGGAVWEQMLGRTHRQGQEEDEVHAKVLASTEFEKAKIWEAWHDCEYVQLAGGGQQKMLMADWALPPTEKHYKVYAN